MSILISDKVNLKTKLIRRCAEEYNIVIQENKPSKEYTAILNISATNTRAPMLIKEAVTA